MTEQGQNPESMIDNQQGPTGTGNYTQYFVIIYKIKKSEKIDIYVCITESLCCIHETNTTL